MRRFLPLLLLLALSFPSGASAEQSPWHLRLSLPSGEVSDAVFATQSDVWAVGPAGVFLSDDSGKSWQFVDMGHSLSAVDAAPDGVHGWAVSSAGVIMATADGGQTWSHQQSGTDVNLADVHAVSDRVAYVFGRGRGLGLGGDYYDEDARILLKTVDGGQTWSEVNVTPGYKVESMDFLDDGEHGWLSVTVTGGHALLKTEDGGASWMTVNSEGERYFDQMQFLTADVGWARAVVRRPYYMERHVLMRTLNGGATWQEVLSLDGNKEVGQFHAFDEGSCVATYDDPAWSDSRVLRTDDGGANWSLLVQGEAEHTKVLTAWDEGHGVRVLGASFSRSDPVTWTVDHRTWQDALMPITAYNGFDFLDDKSAWVGGPKLLHTADGGLSWQVVDHRFFMAVSFISPNEGWGLLGNAYNTPVVHTDDGGLTWQTVYGELSNIFEIKFFDAAHGWMSGGPYTDSFARHTDDGGHTWGGGGFGGRFFVYVDTQVAWCATPPDLGLSSAQLQVRNSSMYVQVTSDGGKSAHSSSFDTPGFCGNPAVAAIDAKHAWVFWNNCGETQTTSEMRMTTDGGETWETISSLPLEAVFSAKFFDSSRGMAAAVQCDGGGQCQEVLLRTSDGGVNWTLERTGIPAVAPANRRFWSPNVKYEFLDAQHMWRIGWRDSAAVEDVYSYDAGAAPPTSILLPPTGSGPQPSASKALETAFLVAMLGATALILGRRLRGRRR